MIASTRMTELVTWGHGSVHVNFWVLVLLLVLVFVRVIVFFRITRR